MIASPERLAPGPAIRRLTVSIRVAISALVVSATNHGCMRCPAAWVDVDHLTIAIVGTGGLAQPEAPSP